MYSEPKLELTYRSQQIFNRVYIIDVIFLSSLPEKISRGSIKILEKLKKLEKLCFQKISLKFLDRTFQEFLLLEIDHRNKGTVFSIKDKTLVSKLRLRSDLA